jgi:diguanylate cyclase (GGDEF)-like protein
MAVPADTPPAGGAVHLSGQQRWSLTGYRVTLPFVALAVGEQLYRYHGSTIAPVMAVVAAVLALLWLLTLIRPVQALAAGIWVISIAAWTALATSLYLVAADLPAGADLMRETAYWTPIACAYWALVFYARPRLAIALVTVFNLLLLVGDLHVRAGTGVPVLHGTPAQAVLKVVILVILVWVFGGLHGKVIHQRNAARSTAVRDPLTGLHNRLSFEHELRRVAQEADRYGHLFGLIIFDIDHFKRFNDDHGHLAGDAVLQAVAEVCRHALRKTDLFCRWGGEEFAVIVHHASARQACRTAEKLRRKVAAQETAAAETITISCGVALYRRGEEARTLFERADTALLMAKEHGRNRVVYWPFDSEETAFSLLK